MSLNPDGPNDASFFADTADAKNASNVEHLSQFSLNLTHRSSLSASMLRQVRNVSIRSDIALEVERVLGHQEYPSIMSLGGLLSRIQFGLRFQMTSESGLLFLIGPTLIGVQSLCRSIYS